MENKHTPAPWELCDIGDYGDFDGNSQVILGTDGFDEPMLKRLAVVQVTKGDEENEANAQLIAAAPELLEALEEVVPLFKSLIQDYAKVADSNGELLATQVYIDNLNKHYVKAESAIKKARGE